MINENENKPRGLIRYVLQVVSHKEWQPTIAQMSEFLSDKLPEFKRQPNGTAKIGFLCETKPIDQISMSALAIESFGEEVADESKYTYRTMHFGIKDGNVKIFIIYDIAKKTQNKWWQIWK